MPCPSSGQSFSTVLSSRPNKYTNHFQVLIDSPYSTTATKQFISPMHAACPVHINLHDNDCNSGTVQTMQFISWFSPVTQYPYQIQATTFILRLFVNTNMQA